MKLLLVKFLTPSEIDCKVILLIGIRLYTSAIFYARIFGMIKICGALWLGVGFLFVLSFSPAELLPPPPSPFPLFFELFHEL